MSSAFENILWRNASVYVSEDQLAHFLDGSPDSRYARIKRAVQAGYLVRVKRGLYYLSSRLVPEQPHPFELAQLIYGPSYISLESALSYHGLIPEAVHTITSATTKRNKEFHTPLGAFSYHRLPIDNFFIGVAQIKENNCRFFMASPWKALLDYIYCYKKNWQNLDPVQESLRIELEDLPILPQDYLSQLGSYYHSRRIERFIKNIPKEFISEH